MESKVQTFWLYPVKDLDNYLGKFFLGIEKEQGQKYKLNTLQSFRYGLNRLLKKRGYNMDITKDAAFANSQRCYAAACLELKEIGLGVVDSAPEITDDGKSKYLALHTQLVENCYKVNCNLLMS